MHKNLIAFWKSSLIYTLPRACHELEPTRGADTLEYCLVPGRTGSESFEPGGLLHGVIADLLPGAVVDGGEDGDSILRIRRGGGGIRCPTSDRVQWSQSSLRVERMLAGQAQDAILAGAEALVPGPGPVLRYPSPVHSNSPISATSS
jgi:hypothetical protein